MDTVMNLMVALAAVAGNDAVINLMAGLVTAASAGLRQELIESLREVTVVLPMKALRAQSKYQSEIEPNDGHRIGYILTLYKVIPGVPGTKVRTLFGEFTSLKEARAHGEALVEANVGYVKVKDVEEQPEPEPLSSAALMTYDDPVGQRVRPEWFLKGGAEARFVPSFFANLGAKDPEDLECEEDDDEDAMNLTHDGEPPEPSAWRLEVSNDPVFLQPALHKRTNCELALERQIKRGVSGGLLHNAVQRALQAKQLSLASCKRLWDLWRVEKFIGQQARALAQGFKQLNDHA